MKIHQIRTSFLNYFKRNDHKIIPSSAIVPYLDPTLMFTASGMVQFKDFFTGKRNTVDKKVATSQKCMRAGGKHNDLENVGYTARHHTFFEMLGNFSFGNYFKEGAVELAWNYLTKELSVDKSKLYITVYSEDEEARKIWKKLTGFSDDRIVDISTSDNFWSMGEFGPCGPCSEIFYDHGPQYQGGLPGTPEEGGDRYIEVWNLVFMQYEQMEDGSRRILPKPCIDTGMGIERIASVMQGVNDNYQTDLFNGLISASIAISGNKDALTSHKVIADHLRSSAFLIADGVMPSNDGRGYVLRRIMRRAMRHIHNLGYKDAMMHLLVPVLVSEMGEAYKELVRAESTIIATLKFEEEKFKDTLEKGLKLLSMELEKLGSEKVLSGEVAFKLYDTYGFPLDLTADILKAKKIGLDYESFDKSMKSQRERAKANWLGSGEKVEEKIWYDIYEKFGATEFLGYYLHEVEGKIVAIVQNGQLVDGVTDGQAVVFLNQTSFYAESGGQIGDKGLLGDNYVEDTKKYAEKLHGHHINVTKEIKVGQEIHAIIDVDLRNRLRANHSAAHLLHFALRKVLGKHVAQKGSLVTDEKLRFDFSHNKAVTKEELLVIEEEVNRMIIGNTTVSTEVMDQEFAVNSGAMALFGEKYGDQVRVVTIGDSVELCGGTHASMSGDIGLLKIVSEESTASGVRRIEAVTGLFALNLFQKKEALLQEITQIIKCSNSEIRQKISHIIDEKRDLEKKFTSLKIQIALQDNLNIEQIGQVNFVYKIFEDVPGSDLKSILSFAKNNLAKPFVVALISSEGSLLLNVSGDLSKRFAAGEVVKNIKELLGAKGGGNDELAQLGNIININKIPDAIQSIKDAIAKI